MTVRAARRVVGVPVRAEDYQRPDVMAEFRAQAERLGSDSSRRARQRARIADSLLMPQASDMRTID